MFNEALKKDIKGTIFKSTSNPTISSSNVSSDPSTVVRSATTGDFFNNKIEKKRKLRFSEAVNVVLIPTVEEYRNANFADVLWWSQSSYAEFKRSALEEIKGAMRQHRSDVKSAMKIIYQPREDDIISTAPAG